jgi:hypothetical protein
VHHFVSGRNDTSSPPTMAQSAQVASVSRGMSAPSSSRAQRAYSGGRSTASTIATASSYKATTTFVGVDAGFTFSDPGYPSCGPGRLRVYRELGVKLATRPTTIYRHDDAGACVPHPPYPSHEYYTTFDELTPDMFVEGQSTHLG